MNSGEKYYDVWFDVHVLGQWLLKRPITARGEWFIPWDLRQGKPLHLEDEPFVAIARPGLVLDYSETLVGIVVINQRLASLWERLGVHEEVQLLPTQVEGQLERYFILNTLNIIRCVDEARCTEVAFWEPHQDESERVDHYRNISGLKIDPAAVGGAHIFRPWGWTGALIVSGRVKQAMEDERILGAKFIDVC